MPYRRRRRKPKPSYPHGIRRAKYPSEAPWEYSNPEQFTTDEAQTATLAYTEGGPKCHKRPYGTYRYIAIGSCVKDALQPAQRAFPHRRIVPDRTGAVVCPPELFPQTEKASGASTSEKAN